MKNSIILTLLTLLSLPMMGNVWDLKVSENHRFLQYADGTPFFWLGDTGWLLPQRLDQYEAAGYLSRAAKAGYNVVQVQVLNGVPAMNAYGQYSNNPQKPWDFSCFDKAKSSKQSATTMMNNPLTANYWDHMDNIIRMAERHNIYIGMVCIWGGVVKSGAMDVEGAKAYGRFLAQRYKNFPNIIWIIGGDIQGNIKSEVWSALAETIKSIDKKHLMTFHPRGRYTSAKWWSQAPWIDFHMYQSGHRAYGQRMGNKDYPIPDNTEEDCWMYVDSTWAYKPIKPVIDGEPSYEDIPIGLHFPEGPRWQASDVRRYAYWDVFAGAFGHTYGHNAIMQMAKPGYAVAYADKSKTWYEAQQDAGYQQMKYLKALMLSFPFFERVPDQQIIASDNGRQYDRLIATRGNDYLMVYNYTSRNMNIDLGKISGKQKNVWWMDASTGNLTYLGKHDSKVITFRLQQNPRPGVHDGVLIAVDAEKNYLSAEQENVLVPIKEKGKKDLTE